jgi:hypothetical protein
MKVFINVILKFSGDDLDTHLYMGVLEDLC